MKKLRIGTLLKGEDASKIIPQILPYGFESFSLTFWQSIGNTDLKELAKKINDILAKEDVIISCLSIFANPLIEEGDGDAFASWQALIEHAHLFNTDLVTGFTGRIPNQAIEKSIPRFKEVFGDLAKLAEDKGVRLAFENCSMGGTWDKGDWNIAHNPTAWNLMFEALPNHNLGLQWEPCHQMLSLIDPIPQLRKWANKIFHVHGKDATIAWDIIKDNGIHGPKQFAWHRTPGFGDSNWTDIISILRQAGYKGTIDIEGFHDPVYKGELEMTGQVQGLNYLKACRGGNFVPNPV